MASENPLSKAAELGNANSLTLVDGINFKPLIINTWNFAKT